MKINKEKLYKLYMEEIDHICEICDWKSSFDPEEIINIIGNIIEKNPNIIEK
jgi:hypothetical protein